MSSRKPIVLGTNPGYGSIYDATGSMIMLISGLTKSALDDAATELSVDYEIFVANYRGPYLSDAYIGFAAMLRQWPLPWPEIEDGALNDLTPAQFYLLWAWEQNNAAMFCLGGDAVATGWEPEEALDCGIVAAVSAAKALVRGTFLM